VILRHIAVRTQSSSIASLLNCGSIGRARDGLPRMNWSTEKNTSQSVDATLPGPIERQNLGQIASLTQRIGTAVEVSKIRRYYLIAIIWIVLLLRTVDLQVMSVLLEPIRAEFHLSDTELGLLTGTAFAIFYAVLGIPVALLADLCRRRTIIATCLGLWSVMTAVCGLCYSFGSLLLARIGVGIGEAGGAPPAYSLVSEWCTAERRSTIFSVLQTSVPMGVFTGFIVGGYVNATLGWRATLMAIGVFGLVVSLVVRLTVPEPLRGSVDWRKEVSARRLVETARYLWPKRSYRHLLMATSVATLGAFGSGIWMLSFFVRVHHLSPLHVSAWLACIYGGGGILGASMGGAITDRLVKKSGDWRWLGWVPAFTLVAILPFAFFVFLWPIASTAFTALLGVVVLMHMWMGPAYGTVQSLAKPNQRSTAAAINLLVVNLLALGCGPLIVGAMSDYLNPRFGENAIRYSILLLVTTTYAWAAIHFFLASKTVRGDLRS
jgi:predicted MFS family arabinose efflux permease